MLLCIYLRARQPRIFAQTGVYVNMPYTTSARVLSHVCTNEGAWLCVPVLMQPDHECKCVVRRSVPITGREWLARAQLSVQVCTAYMARVLSTSNRSRLQCASRARQPTTSPAATLSTVRRTVSLAHACGSCDCFHSACTYEVCVCVCVCRSVCARACVYVCLHWHMCMLFLVSTEQLCVPVC